MKGILEGIRDGLYNEPSKLQSALEEANRMENLVFDMLEISKYEAKGIELNRTIFSLDESVNRVYRRFSPMALDKSLGVSLNLEEGFIDADQEKKSNMSLKISYPTLLDTVSLMVILRLISI